MEKYKDTIKKYKIDIQTIEQEEKILGKISKAESKIKSKQMLNSELDSMDESRRFLEFNFNHIWKFLPHPLIQMKNIKELVLLDDSKPELRTQIKFLDKEYTLRRSIRIGVIYVRRGQLDQNEILRNHSGSENYEKMLKGLGNCLNKNLMRRFTTSQINFLYYGSTIYELVYHVVTKMTANPNDVQQLEKKKFVGNDSVHIVWTENDHLYNPTTITGSFNFVHIIVYPLRNGLYRIIIHKKKDKNEPNNPLVKFFGPLLTGMVVPMQILPILLRCTAINARMNITNKNLKIINPIRQRRESLKKIINTYKISSKNYDLKSELLQLIKQKHDKK